MHNQPHDAIVEMDAALARVRALSRTSRDWIETHVTLAQVVLWTGSILEVPAQEIRALVTGMLADGLQVLTRQDQDHGPGSEGWATCS